MTHKEVVRRFLWLNQSSEQSPTEAKPKPHPPVHTWMDSSLLSRRRKWNVGADAGKSKERRRHRESVCAVSCLSVSFSVRLFLSHRNVHLTVLCKVLQCTALSEVLHIHVLFYIHYITKIAALQQTQSYSAIALMATLSLSFTQIAPGIAIKNADTELEM